MVPTPIESTPERPLAGAGTQQIRSAPQADGTSLAAAAPPAPKAAGGSSFDEQTSRELPTERDSHTSVYENSDGSRTLKVSEDPVNYRLPDGTWAKVDDTLAPMGGSATDPDWWRTRAAANPVDVATKADAARLATLHTGNGTSVGFGLDGATPSVGKTVSDSITFTGARPQSDVNLKAGDGEIKETILLNSPSAPDTWDFPLHLAGLTASLDASGNVALTDVTGAVQAMIPHGWMMDSAVDPASGEGATSGGVTYELVVRADRTQVLRVKLDRAWLDAPGRVYPVKVDPTVAVTPASNSVSIVQGRNFFQTDVYRLGYNCDSGCANAAILLNTSAVSAQLQNNTITGARLAMWNVHSWDCQAPRTVTVHGNTGSWNPSSVRWPGPSYGPALGSASFALGNESDGCNDGWGVVDLGTGGRDLIQGWVTGAANNGLTVRTAQGDPKTWKKFDTAPNGGVKLDIDYTPFRAAYRFNSLVREVTATQDGIASVTVTNNGAVGWTKGIHSLHYRLFNASGTELNTVAWTQLPNDVPPGQSVTLDATIAKLPPGTYTLAWDMDGSNIPKFSQLGVPPLPMALGTSNKWPVITSMTPGNGYESDSTTPTFTVAGNDPDNWPRPSLDYRFEVCVVEAQDYRKNCQSSLWQTPASFTVPTSWNLAKGGTYAWYAYIGDGTDASLRPNPAVFTIPNRPPAVDTAWPPSGYTFSTLTPMLHVTGHDRDAWPVNQPLRYKFEVCEVDGANTRKDCHTSDWQPSSPWTVPKEWNLTWGKTYSWYGTVGDSGGADGTFARQAMFSTQVPQPAITSRLAAGAAGREFNEQVGNYTTAATDASVSAVGPDLTVSRTYNSLDPRTDTAFGAGWASRWDMRAIPDNDGSGNVVVVLATGGQMRFGRNADGSYAAPSGGFATFTAVSGGGWQLADKSGTRQTFDAAGRLISVADYAGRTQQITYGPDGRIARATDVTSGRYLGFTWTGAHVTQAGTNPIDATTPGPVWTYGYDGDRLTSVCPPVPGGTGPTAPCTRYDYTTGSHYRSVVMDAGPRSYWRLGDTGPTSNAADSVPTAAAREGAEYRNVTLGQAGALAGSPDQAAGFNGTSSSVRLPTDIVGKSTFLSVEMWFKTTGAGVLFSQQARALDDPAGVGGEFNPALYIDANGKLRGRFLTRGATPEPITSAGIVTDDQWHHVVLSAAGTAQTLYLDGQVAGTLSGEVYHPAGNNTLVGAGFAQGVPQSPGAIGYFNGSIDDVALYERPLGATGVAEHYAARGVANQLTKVTSPSGRTHAEVTYDARTDRVTQVTDANGGAWKVAPPTYTASSAAYASAITASAPVAYYRLGEQGGTGANNAFGSAGAGTYHEVIPGRAGAFAGGDDTAAEFNGTTSHVELPQNLLRNNPRLSIELWFRTDKPGVLVGHQSNAIDDPAGVGGTYTPALYIDTNGKLRGKFMQADAAWAAPVASAQSVTDSRWHHAVLTADGSVQLLYLDGAKAGSINGAINHESSSRVYLGAGFVSGWAEAPGTVGRFDGSMDEVAVYDRAIDAAAVTEHFAARGAVIPNSAPAYRAAVASSGPWSYYRLNETSGSEVTSQQGARATNGAARAFATSGSPYGATFDEGSAEFNGTSSYIELPQGMVHGSSQATIEMSFETSKPGVIFGYQSAGIGESQTTYTPALYVDTDGKLRAKFFTTSGTALPQIVTETSVDDSRWHHVVLTTDGVVQTLYLDGVVAGTISGAVFHEKSLRSFVGAGTTSGYEKAPAGSGYFEGWIDEVAVYRKTLDAATVAAHADAADGLAPDYRKAVLAAGPTGYWPLTESDSGTAPIDLVPGPATDAAGSWNVRQAVEGAFGATGDRAAGFDGTSSHIRMPKDQLTAVTQFTTELWFQAEGPGVLMGYSTQDMPYSGVDTPATPMLYVGTDGQLRGEIWNGTAAPITSTESVLDGRWHHAALSVDVPGKTQRLYLDGNLVGAPLDATAVVVDPYITIGAGPINNLAWPAKPTDVRGYFKGAIDEVAIHHQALSADTIARHYASGNSAEGAALTTTTTVTDPNNRQERRTYDLFRGRALSVTDVEGATTTYGYDSGGFRHTVTDANGNSVISGHDARGNEISRTTCRTTTQCWTGYQEFYLNKDNPLDPRNDQLIAVRDPRSAEVGDNTYKTTYAYTTTGHPSGETRPDGSTTQRAYTTGTEPAIGGGTVPAGLLASTTQPGDRVTTFAYYANGDLAATTDPVGLITRQTHDGLGRRITTTEVSDSVPAGVTTTTTYDHASRPTTATGPGVRNEITGVTHTLRGSTVYDVDGRVVEESTADLTGGDTTRTSTYTYDTKGRLETATDPEGGVTRTGYDAFGRLASTIDPVGGEIHYTYTPGGLPAETVLIGWDGDPSGTPRDLVVESRAYDPAGRLASVTDAMGATTSYTYYDDDTKAETIARGVNRPEDDPRDIVLERLSYDGAGNVARSITGGTTITDFTYDTQNRPVRTVLDPGGLNRESSTAYDPAGFVARTQRTGAGITTPEATDFVYDKAGRVVRRTAHNETGTPRVDDVLVDTVRRDQRGLVLEEVSPNGNAAGSTPSTYAVTHTYDVLGREVSTASPTVEVTVGGAAPTNTRPTTTVGYNAFGEPVVSRDANGRVTSSVTDRAGRTTATTLPPYTPPGATQPITATTQVRYDKAGRVVESTDALGRTGKVRYDRMGNIVEKTAPEAPVQQSALAISGTDSGPLLNLPFADAPPKPATWHYTYDANGRRLSSVDPDGARTEATYDQLGRQLTSTRVERFPTADNFTTTMTYDDAGRPVSTKSPTGREIRQEYNLAGQPTRRWGDVAEMVTDYDGVGRLVRTYDGQGRGNRWVYSPLGRVDAVQDIVMRYNGSALGEVSLRASSLAYDANGNQVSTSKPGGGRTDAVYDAAGRLLRQTEKVNATDSIVSSFGYDAMGNRTRFTDGKGNSTVYTHTAWDQPESVIEPATTAHPNPADRTWTTTYDAVGQATGQSAPGGVRSNNTYDHLGRLVEQTGTGAEAVTDRRVFAYDDSGRLTKAQTFGAVAPKSTNTYTYNDRGLQLTAAGSSGNAQYTWDAEGQLAERTDAAGTARFAYNRQGQPYLASDPQTGYTVEFGYDGSGNVAGETFWDHWPVIEWPSANRAAARSIAQPDRRFTYDDLGRLTNDEVVGHDDVSKLSTSYTYDIDGRMTGKDESATGGRNNTYAYDLAGRLTQWNDGTTVTPYTWDAAGNRTGAGAKTATYDERNRLLTAGDTAYAYTPRGTRSTITVPGLTKSMQFDAFEQLAQDSASYGYDAQGRMITRDGQAGFAYDGTTNNLVADGGTKFTRAAGGDLIATGNGTTATLAVTDQHGDVTAALDPTTLDRTTSTTYDPFGQVTSQTGARPGLGYQGAWTDPTTGQVNMASRWYDPASGGFDSRDTWTLDPSPSGNANRYAYGGGNPLGNTDPSGHCIDGCVVEAIALSMLVAWAGTTLADQCRRSCGALGQSLSGAVSGAWSGAKSAGSSLKNKWNSWTGSGGGTVTGSAVLSTWWLTRSTTANNTAASSAAAGTRAGDLNAWACRTYGACGSSGGSGTGPGTGGPGAGPGTGGPGGRCVIGCRGGNTKGPGKGPTGKPPIKPKPKPPHRPTAPKNRPPTTATPITDPMVSIIKGLLDGTRTFDTLQSATNSQPNPVYDPDQVAQDEHSLEMLKAFFPEEGIDTDMGFGDSGADINRRRTGNKCQRDLPSKEAGYFYAPMTKFGPDDEDCRATGAVAIIDGDDVRTGLTRRDPKWKPAGYTTLPADNRAALHLIADNAGGARYTLRNFVAGYQNPANSPDMSGLERDIQNAATGGQVVSVGVLPIYGDPTRHAGVPDRIRMVAYGSGGYALNCTVYNRPQGGYDCTQRTSGGALTHP
ncbi:LamG-like jellyroll fold domain-containing protein [Embleya sp. NPDC005971]|uniref:LamG-like jellyroll fold domain-containing protein n=1 Tax=Embleya sp. NPDC005971 TaxID=3156724 RepID=UPI0033DEF6AF